MSEVSCNQINLTVECNEISTENECICNVIKIIGYNVHGLASKILFNEFFDFVKMHDVFVLSETFVVSENFSRYEKFFGGFTLKWVSARRVAAVGRASGGMLLGYKSTKREWNANWRCVNGRDIVIVKIKEKEIRVVPIYVNCSDWESEFREIENLLSLVSRYNCILIGDFNARIGELQGLECDNINWSESVKNDRKSYDGVINARGRKLIDLMDDMGMIVLNGRTNGDMNGELTFLGAMGESVIDYACVSGSIIDSVSKFEVCAMNHSDHMPIVLELKIERNENCLTNMRLLPRLRWNWNMADQYRAKVKAKLEGINVGPNDNMNVRGIIDVVKSSAIEKSDSSKPKVFKAKWYDWQCERARRKVFKWLNIWRRTKDRKDEIKARYKEANRAYTCICVSKQMEYYKRVSGRLAQVTNMNEWWKLANELKGKVPVISTGIRVESFAEYYAELLGMNGSSRVYCYAEPYVTDPWLDSEISLNEILDVISALKDGKAPGDDRIPTEFFKYAPLELLGVIRQLFNRIWNSLNVDECFNRSLVFPIHKKGDVNAVENYRGISFGNTIGKIFVGILNNRLQEWVDVNGKLNECQAGFRKGYSTVDNIFCFECLVRLKWKENVKKVYCFFVDFRAAFDRVNRQAMLYKLSQMGVSTKFIAIVKSLYESTSAAVWNGQELSEWFVTSSGVRQGCILSPLLFALFLNDLEGYLGGGVNVGEKVIRVLMYADDIVLFAQSAGELQDMMNKLEMYCSMWDLEVNLNKSEVMIMKQGGGKLCVTDKWCFKGNPVRVASRYKYLGVIMKPSMKWVDHVQERVRVAKSSCNTVWSCFMDRKEASFKDKMKLFESVCRSIVGYACQVWGLCEFEKVERLRKWFIKRVLGLPRTTPDYVLYLETGVETIYLFTLQCHMGYIRKVLFQQNTERLPNFLARMMIESNIGWYQEWLSMAGKHGIVCDLENGINAFDRTTADILRAEKALRLNVELGRARSTETHGFFNVLQYVNGHSYVQQNFTTHKIGMIMRVRSGMISLNSNIWRVNEARLCSLCNLREVETVFHFLGVCPIVGDVRNCMFGCRSMTRERCISILNGEDWNKLYEFMCCAGKIRQTLVNEFNF